MLYTVHVQKGFILWEGLQTVASSYSYTLKHILTGCEVFQWLSVFSLIHVPKRFLDTCCHRVSGSINFRKEGKVG